MPINPLSKLLERRQPLRPDAEKALTQLARLSEQYPDLATVAATHAALFRVAFVQATPDTLPVPKLALDSATAATKLQAGVPLLRGEPIVLEGRWLRERYLQLCKALIDLPRGRTETDTSNRLEALRQAVRSGKLNIQALAVDVIAGDPLGVVQRASNLELDAELAATLLRWTMLPLMEQLGKQSLPLRKNAHWDRGYCPTCGAWPLLGERRGIEQMLFFRCGLCASDWESEHLFCPFCTSRSHLDIAYLYDDAQEANQRAVTCERCHGYYKSVTTLVPLSTPQLFVTDLETLHLDLIALERAYGPPA